MAKFLFAALFALMSQATTAAELKVFCPGAVKTLVTDLASDFTKASGHALVMAYGTAGSVAKQVSSGIPGDIVITTVELMNGLAKENKVDSQKIRPIGSMGVGMANRQGSPKPDIKTVKSFSDTLLAAKSITFADPAFGGQSGIHVAKVLANLGLTEQLKAKLKLRRGFPEGVMEVASGEIEIGIGQISEILASPGVQLLGPLPKEIQAETTFVIAPLSTTADLAAAQSFIDFLALPSSKEKFRRVGFELK